jgi:hypothetical protein
MAARLVASLLARPLRAWASFWEVDPSVRLRSREELLAYFEQTAERNAELRKSSVQAYAREHVLPRLSFQQGKLQVQPRAAGVPGAQRTGL